jgi:hypothetical protein
MILDDFAEAARQVEAARTIEQLEAIAAALGLVESRNPQAFLLRGLIESRRRVLSGRTPGTDAPSASQIIDPSDDRTK